MNQTNNIFNLDTYKIYIDWIINEESHSFIFSIISEINATEKKNLIKDNHKNNNEEIIDFINIINKKQNFISTQYKLAISDYNQFDSLDFSMESHHIYSNQILNDLIQLSLFLEKNQNKINSKNKIESKEKDLYQREISKIYNKVIDISTKINKIEILFDYLDKLESLKKKRIYNIFDDDYESDSDEENKKEMNKFDNIFKVPKDNSLVCNNISDKNKVLSMINKINKSKDEHKNNQKRTFFVSHLEISGNDIKELQL